MQKIVLMLCSFIALTMSVVAQTNTPKNEEITLGGNSNKSLISIPQIVDYPMLVVQDKEIQIQSFELTITLDGVNTSGLFMAMGAKFTPEMIEAIKQFGTPKSVLKLQHIQSEKRGKLRKEEALEFNLQ
ncbi:MAG: hypothetical protein QM530_02810 [Phycisphaerales bacterium]|nr:hypothetical protein [Phycisphaerales bacterium]